MRDLIGYRKDRFVPTLNESFPSDPLATFHDPFLYASPGACFGAMAVPLAIASVAMTVVGGVMQASAQQEAGEVAYQNSLQKAALLNAEAKQREAEANKVQAVKQREGIEANRKYVLAASRARAVMAAGGGGVDEGIIAGILSEGDYAKDVSLYEGDEAARGLQNQATMDRYSANTARVAGHNARIGAGQAAAMTLIGTGAKAGMSLGQMYAPGPPPGATNAGIAGGFGDYLDPSQRGGAW
jgi:hypothetical protein